MYFLVLELFRLVTPQSFQLYFAGLLLANIVFYLVYTVYGLVAFPTSGELEDLINLLDKRVAGVASSKVAPAFETYTEKLAVYYGRGSK